MEDVKITTEPLVCEGSGELDNEICGKKQSHLNEKTA
jgi:hypothetical protein